MMKYKVLVIDDELLIRMSLESGLSDLGYQVRCADTISEGLSLAAKLHPDAILLDNRVGEERGIDRIPDFKKLDEDVILILMTAYGSVSQAVEAMKLGVSHYVQKPFDLDEIDLVITRAMEQLLSRRSLELMKLRPRKLLGESSAICRIRQEIRVLAENDNVDILICGETGTGKEVVVNTIHEQSSRHDKPLVKINCGAIPENLLESELFGHEKGSFTGADKTKKGLIELANGGTVFLDEVGELPLAMQAKLLTFLEDRSFKRVGGLQDIEVNIRVAAATNRDLEAEVQKGRFREDLYYRLNTFPIHIPPLRERTGDIPALAAAILDQLSHKLRRPFTLTDEAVRLLQAHSWPGNVRELRNVLEFSAYLTPSGVITCEAFPADLRRPAEHDAALPLVQRVRAFEKR